MYTSKKILQAGQKNLNFYNRVFEAIPINIFHQIYQTLIERVQLK